jgi:hypothetical protein
MDVFILIAILILVFVGVPLGVIYLGYLLPKKLGYPRIGKYLSIVIGLFVVSIVLITVFQDQLFTKNNAKTLVEGQGILLSDSFEIEHNKSMSAIGDYYHTFTLAISAQDKARAIDRIKSSANFKSPAIAVVDLLSEAKDRYNGPTVTQNYETEKSYVREYFKPNGEGYAPTFRRISIDKKEDKLVFEDIDD